MIEKTKCGKIVVIGITNSGKSSLINKLIDINLLTISHKINTTWNDNIHAIFNNKNIQLIFIDTPGNYIKKSTLLDSDIVLHLINGKITNYDINMYKNYIDSPIKIIICINKIDRLKRLDSCIKIIKNLNSKLKIDEIFPISVKKNINIKELKSKIIDLIPEKDFIYPKEYITNISNSQIINEILKEAIFKYTNKELPYLIKIVVKNVKDYDNKFNCEILVKSLNVKKIVIGKKGKKINLILKKAKNKIEKIFKKNIDLNLNIDIIK